MRTTTDRIGVLLFAAVGVTVMVNTSFTAGVVFEDVSVTVGCWAKPIIVTSDAMPVLPATSVARAVTV